MSDKPMVWIDGDGVANYRASSLYSCFNALLLTRLGYEGDAPPPWLQQRFDAGHDHEPLILRKLTERYGFNLVGAQDEVVIPIGTTARVVGHVDALHIGSESFPMEITHMNGEPMSRPIDIPAGAIVVVDAKALAVSTFASWSTKRFDAMPYYAWQQRAYMIGTDAVGLVMAVKNKNTDDMRVEFFTVDYMDNIVKKTDIMRKVLAVEAAAKVGNTEIFAQPCTPMMPCPFWKMHPKDVDDPDADVDLIALASVVTERQSAKAEENAAKARYESANDQILQLMGKAKTSVRIPRLGTVSTYHHSYPTVDWEAIEKACNMTPGTAKDRFTTPQQSKSLSVRFTPKKESK